MGCCGSSTCLGSHVGLARVGTPPRPPAAVLPQADVPEGGRQRAEHEDAVLLSPGHPLFAATSESLLRELGTIEQGAAPFVAPWAIEPFAIHFFTHRVHGLDLKGEPEDVYAELSP